jgi:hypothetical protein
MPWVIKRSVLPKILQAMLIALTRRDSARWIQLLALEDGLEAMTMEDAFRLLTGDELDNGNI